MTALFWTALAVGAVGILLVTSRRTDRYGWALITLSVTAEGCRDLALGAPVWALGLNLLALVVAVGALIGTYTFARVGPEE